jgi:hypothetical protein
MAIILSHVNADVKERRLVIQTGAMLEIASEVTAPTGGRVRVSAKADGGGRIDNDSRVRTRVNGVEARSADLKPGDRLEIGAAVYVVEQVRRVTASDDAVRSSRRVSAARMPASRPRSGFWQQLFSILSGRRRRARNRLRICEQERQVMLAQIGRLALRPDVGIGLPARVVSELQSQCEVCIHPDEVQMVHLERWLSLGQRVALLDAQIITLRRELGQPEAEPDPQAVPALHSDQRQHQDRCFAELDAHDTVELDLNSLETPPPSGPARGDRP